jgi:hypothetical protein
MVWTYGKNGCGASDESSMRDIIQVVFIMISPGTSAYHLQYKPNDTDSPDINSKNLRGVKHIIGMIFHFCSSLIGRNFSRILVSQSQSRDCDFGIRSQRCIRHCYISMLQCLTRQYHVLTRVTSLSIRDIGFYL